MTEYEDRDAMPREGLTLVEVHMRLYLDEDGDLQHATEVTGHGDDYDLPPEYAALGAWEMAKDSIKSYYSECDDPDCGECNGDD